MANGRGHMSLVALLESLLMFPTLIPFTRRPVITLISTFPGYSSLFNFVLILSIASVLSFVRKGHKGKKKNQKKFQTLTIEKKRTTPNFNSPQQYLPLLKPGLSEHPGR